jgi:hypothetical protein
VQDRACVLRNRFQEFPGYDWYFLPLAIITKIGAGSLHGNSGLAFSGIYQNIIEPVSFDGKIFMLLQQTRNEPRMLMKAKHVEGNLQQKSNAHGGIKDSIQRMSWVTQGFDGNKENLENFNPVAFDEKQFLTTSEIFPSIVPRRVGDGLGEVDLNNFEEKRKRDDRQTDWFERGREFVLKLLVVDRNECRCINYNFGIC